jgi:glycosyltransferase involved in cell wall biosynthesis
MAIMGKGVSVIICCYNSALRLPATLKYLAQQKITGAVPWEIIIVNNASKDNTSAVAGAEWSQYGKNNIDFRVVDQPVPGLAFAREKGVAESNYDYLIFCDDDNWLSETYVETAFNLLESWPDAAVIGGHGVPVPELEPPAWFTNYAGYFATGSQNTHDGIIEGNNPYVYGAGVVVRKSVLLELNRINFKFIATDRLNDKLSSGADVEMCYVIKLLGKGIAYYDGLKFSHFIPANRLSDSYLLGLVYQFGYCDILHRPYYWVFNPSLSKYKKNWMWTFLISLNIYALSWLKLVKGGNPENQFVNKVNFEHSKGRLHAIVKLNRQVQKNYAVIRQKFKREID